ncbi:NTP transferase domain-containing protein [Paenibacillus paeoniae]|uniref:Phosphocholine cytidylyltransferase family protein n=1 Tax=Paenibacillus paeoniae TaxID=2292705 RepID=A0A371P0U9_9BACL|nr:phosphocholine cytidylyltransferase family protein [Paenibacillus paeoniae]REK69577.1 phosphocholine cytidylyltransferase family protein [Paenibacillus paeoniae]
MTKAILMAAGRGTRISREIDGNCKCTLDIGGTTLIRHTVQMLLDHGIEVHIVVGYNKELIINALKGLPVNYHVNYFYLVTNSLSSLWFAKEQLHGDSIILGNADVFWEKNLLPLLLEDPRDCVMLCDSSRVEQGDYLFRVENGAVREFGKGLDKNIANCEYVGLAKIQGPFIREFKSELEYMIEAQRHNAWWEQILYNMIPARNIWTSDISGHFWAEIDYIEDYQRILEYRERKLVK